MINTPTLSAKPGQAHRATRRPADVNGVQVRCELTNGTTDAHKAPATESGQARSAERRTTAKNPPARGERVTAEVASIHEGAPSRDPGPKGAGG